MNHKYYLVAGFLCCFFTAQLPSHAQQTSNLKKLKKVSFQTADTSMNIVLNARMQNRLDVTNQYSETLRPTEAQFQTRRFRLKAKGFLVGPRLKFKMELAFSKSDLRQQMGEWGNNLYDAYFTYDLTNSLAVRFGQFKLPGNRQRVISSGNLQLIDRSPVNSAFNLDRDIGLMLLYEQQLDQAFFRYNVSLSNGEGRDILSSRYRSNRGELNLAITQRAEFLPFGAFTNRGDYFEGDLMREEKPKLSLAAGYYYNNDAIRSQGQLGLPLYEARDINSFFADLIYKHRGWSIMAEFNQMDSPDPITFLEGAPGAEDLFSAVRSGMGYMIQAGYLFPSFWEIAARYSEVIPENEVLGFQQTESETLLGINKYFRGHYIKVQTDVGYVYDAGMEPGLESYWRWRLQMELGF